MDFQAGVPGDRAEYPSVLSIINESFWRIADKRMGPIVIVLGGLLLFENFPSLNDNSMVKLFVCILLALPFMYLTNRKFKLIRAALQGETDVVQELIASKGDVNRPSHDGSTALSGAALVGHIDVVRLLCGAGAHVDQGRAGDRPLLHAAEWGHVAVVQHLLTSGASVNLANMARETPLSKAIHRNRSQSAEVMQLLCDARASLNVVSHKFGDNETPLLMAVRVRNVNAVKILCIEGAERDEADQLAEVPTLRNDAPGASIADFLNCTRGFSTRLHYVEHMNVKQVHAALRQSLPRSARSVPEVAKRVAAASEPCAELLRLWAWRPEAHTYFPPSHKRLVQSLLLISKRLGGELKSDADSCSWQRIFVAHTLPFVIDRTDDMDQTDGGQDDLD